MKILRIILGILALLGALVFLVGGGICLGAVSPSGSDVWGVTLIFFVPGGLLALLALGLLRWRKKPSPPRDDSRP
jgi:hypothetical protein